ncbi:hypothetical protein HID58_045142, partial [Brassica napus]
LKMDASKDDDFTFSSVVPSDSEVSLEAKDLASRVDSITLKDALDPQRSNKPLSQVPPKEKTVGSLSFTVTDSSSSSKPSNESSSEIIKARKPITRTKVPFEKGYSQMDWLKLTRTHPDLAGLKGESNRRLISMDEVKKHNKTGDSMWTVLKGRVYNITPYMNFHPGGVDMLMKAVGRDGTLLFNKYHAWVSYDILLEKCLVGVLDDTKVKNLESSFSVQQRSYNPKKCNFLGCMKGARGSSGLCISHGGGGERCQKPGCNKGTESSKTTFCKTHGGGKRCEHLGCTKSAERKTDYCISHGGGRRCGFIKGCDKAARGKSGLCIKHGGGKRCVIESCARSAEGQAGLCISHGGGRRCQFSSGCDKGAQGITNYCKAHGGGKRCIFSGCGKGAEGSTPLCKAHGGGKRCLSEGGGICSKSVHGGTNFCVAHGGGKRCVVEGCTKSARGRTDCCVKHGGGKRCRVGECGKSAQGSGELCKAHGGGKRCCWGGGECEKFARGKSGLCAKHNSVKEKGEDGGSKSGLIGPGLFSGLVVGSSSDHSQCEVSAIELEKRQKMMIPMQVLVPSSMRSLSDSHEGDANVIDFMIPEERVHGGGMMIANKVKTRMEFRGDANKRIAMISAHLQPSFTPQMEAKNSVMGRENCRAKGGNPGFKVAILGAAGGIGQSLSLLMKMNPLVSLLHLYDVVNAPGVTADVSHMDTGAVVRGFLGAKQLEDALTGMDLVIIPAGVPRKPGMTRDDLFKINAGIVKTLCEGVAKCCPNAIVNLISNPVNSTVAIAAEVFKKAGTYDPKKLLGVTTLDVARANTFVAEVLGLDPREVDVPVVGGHAGVTILPLLSQVKPPSSFTPSEIEYLTNRIQNGGTEVVEAKAGAGSATLSMAYAAAKFADACLRGLRGDANVIECSFVASQVTELAFFATKVRLGRTGAEEVFQLGPLNEYERVGLEKAKEELAGSIQKGVDFIRK